MSPPPAPRGPLRRHPILALALVAVCAVAARECTSNSRLERDQNDAARMAAQLAAQRAAKLQSICPTDAEGRKAEAAQALKRAGGADAAIALLQECDEVADEHSRKLLRDARAKKAEHDSRQAAAKARAEGVSIGMTREQILASAWGKPTRINTTAKAGGTREQWVYGNGNYLYVTDGILTSIQTSQSIK